MRSSSSSSTSLPTLLLLVLESIPDTRHGEVGVGLRLVRAAAVGVHNVGPSVPQVPNDRPLAQDDSAQLVVDAVAEDGDLGTTYLLHAHQSVGAVANHQAAREGVPHRHRVVAIGLQLPDGSLADLHPDSTLEVAHVVGREFAILPVVLCAGLGGICGGFFLRDAAALVLLQCVVGFSLEISARLGRPAVGLRPRRNCSRRRRRGIDQRVVDEWVPETEDVTLVVDAQPAPGTAAEDVLGERRAEAAAPPGGRGRRVRERRRHGPQDDGGVIRREQMRRVSRESPELRGADVDAG